MLADGSFVTFTFVRHPVHRMLATYINKLTKEPKESEEYRIYMGQLYGRDYVEKNDLTKARRPSFDEFIARLAMADESRLQFRKRPTWVSSGSPRRLSMFFARPFPDVASQTLRPV
mmetsp:Transcript_40600/g.161022  ORF Transcript_40600/g.161022 Transcript_40600/m.161022 type:complete len:116 (+) Transcript_40600:1375-1722(+)